MLGDSEPEEEYDQSLNWVMVDKAKQKWVSNPHGRVKNKIVCLFDVECSYPPKEVPTPIVEEWQHTLQKTKPELTANAWRHAPPKERGARCEPQNPQAIAPDSPET